MLDFLKDFFRFLLQDLCATLRGRDTFGLPLRNLDLFHFPEEIETILSIARKYFPEDQDYPVNPYALILAIRVAERGRKGFEFGVVAVKDTDLRTQCEWACATVRENFKRFRESEEKDFIAFLGKRYAPVGASNDPGNLNQYWVDNVRFYYNLFAVR